MPNLLASPGEREMVRLVWHEKRDRTIFQKTARKGGHMILGVMSDTHNHVAAARLALEALAEAGADGLVHCGDIGEDVLDILSAECLARGVRGWAALGNCDSPADVAYRGCPAGVELARAVEFTADGKACAVLHGDDWRTMDRMACGGRLDYLFVGHTHRPALERQGRTVILNPGSAARPRNGIPSVAVLDTDSGEARWIALDQLAGG